MIVNSPPIEILWGAFSWSNAMAQTQAQEHKHEQHEEVKEAAPSKGVTMKDQMKEKMKEKDEGYEMLSKGGSERTEKLKSEAQKRQSENNECRDDGSCALIYTGS